MSSPTELVHFHSTNPYSAKYPNRRVLSRRALQLVKHLRHRGYTVEVGEDPALELNYLNQSGLPALLADPIWAMVIGIPISVATGLLSNLIWEKRTKSKSKPRSGSAVFELDDSGKRLRYNWEGQPLNEGEFRAVLDTLQARQQHYREACERQPLDSIRPFPVFEEHSGPVVGWAKVWETSDGLSVDIHVANPETYQRVKTGELRGYSVGGLVRKATCSVCGLSFFECNHPAEPSKEKDCRVTIEQIDLAEVSLVRDPLYPLESVRIRFGD